LSADKGGESGRAKTGGLMGGCKRLRVAGPAAGDGLMGRGPRPPRAVERGYCG
jgi:hypothetical protein